MINKLDFISILVGRSLLGLYFLGPGLAKIFDYSNYVAVMQENQVPLTLVALPVVILIQVIGGIMLIINLHVKFSVIMRRQVFLPACGGFWLSAREM